MRVCECVERGVGVCGCQLMCRGGLQYKVGLWPSHCVSQQSPGRYIHVSYLSLSHIKHHISVQRYDEAKLIRKLKGK